MSEFFLGKLREILPKALVLFPFKDSSRRKESCRVLLLTLNHKLLQEILDADEMLECFECFAHIMKTLEQDAILALFTQSVPLQEEEEEEKAIPKHNNRAIWSTQITCNILAQSVAFLLFQDRMAVTDQTLHLLSILTLRVSTFARSGRNCLLICEIFVKKMVKSLLEHRNEEEETTVYNGLILDTCYSLVDSSPANSLYLSFQNRGEPCTLFKITSSSHETYFTSYYIINILGK